ncbi:hypothetical protein CVT24_007312 [Panaeolus cyanescens]|uniref:FYVE-type domain-containing protein n=1 Tax=Panaeolus cyanescens TaxID=181874 RepID=A0A409YPK1_9AGAR|nr:hypothetical protein CVT24_007312 [Panaeolus cyanescens]
MNPLFSSSVDDDDVSFYSLGIDSLESVPSLTDSVSTVSDSTSSSTRTLSDSATIPIQDVSLRANEHRAISLPSELWQPDSDSKICDNMYCGAPFTFFDRRHHCRKCGGVFCHACTAQKTTLLDISNLSFHRVPRGVPITTFESPTSRVVESRVCTDCWEEIYGYPPVQNPNVEQSALHRIFAAPSSLFRQPLYNFFVAPSALSSASLPIMGISQSPSTPSGTRKSSLRSASSLSSLSSSLFSNRNSPDRGPSKRVTFALPEPSTSKESPSQQHETATSQFFDAHSSCEVISTPRTTHFTVAESKLKSKKALLATLAMTERSYGEMAAYPLSRSSVLCKTLGGGRWEPEPCSTDNLFAYAPVKGWKTQWQLDLEEEERLEHERKYRPNPVIQDGPIKYRIPKEYEEEPLFTIGTPRNDATF